MVTTLEQLELLKQELMNVKEFAIDLEVKRQKAPATVINGVQNHLFIISCDRIRRCITSRVLPRNK